MKQPNLMQAMMDGGNVGNDSDDDEEEEEEKKAEKVEPVV